MKVAIEYCVKSGYSPRAVGLAEQVLAEFERDLSELTLIPSGGGVFEVTLGDDLLYSKKATGRHAEYDEVLKSIRSHISLNVVLSAQCSGFRDTQQTEARRSLTLEHLGQFE